MVAGILDSAFGLTVVFGGIIGSQLPSMIKGFKALKTILKSNTMMAIGEAVASAAASAAAIPGIGWLLAGAAAAGLGALLYTYVADDMVQTPTGYGKRTIVGPEGSIALNNNDTIVAGTDLGQGSKEGESVKSSPSIDLTPMISAINEVTSAVNQLNSKKWDVYLDSKVVGTGLMQKSYKSA
jgi:hypothetical protein